MTVVSFVLRLSITQSIPSTVRPHINRVSCTRAAIREDRERFPSPTTTTIMKVTAMRKRLATYPGAISVVVTDQEGTARYPITGMEIDRWELRLITGPRKSDHHHHPHDLRNAVAPIPHHARKAVAPSAGGRYLFHDMEDHLPEPDDLTEEHDGMEHDELTDLAGMDGHLPGTS